MKRAHFLSWRKEKAKRPHRRTNRSPQQGPLNNNNQRGYIIKAATREEREKKRERGKRGERRRERRRERREKERGGERRREAF